MSSGTLNALLLEDEPLISMDLEVILRTAGFDVKTIMSGLEGHAWLARHRPDVVIVDIQLRDGPCGKLVADLLESAIPFVVYTGEHCSFHTDTPFARGVWVSKPAAPQDLIDAVRAAIGGSDRRAEFRARSELPNGASALLGQPTAPRQPYAGAGASSFHQILRSG